jgi:ABC-2 type transport system permease protein
MVNIKPDERQFRDSYQPVAVLLEGEFQSLYKNRGLTKDFIENKFVAFKDKSTPTSMIVVSDGDVIKNVVQRSTHKIFPLGYDLATQRTFGNKNFILNCIDYLCDDSGILSVRSREVKLRLLDKKKIKTQKFKWQVINTAIPLAVIIFAALTIFNLRRRRYAK